MADIERADLIEPDNQRVWPQHVKRARAYMLANMAEQITLAGLALACGVPERTLLGQFQRFVGVAPLAYLRRLRLDVAKSELASAHNNDAISDIAIRCGFTHLGRFATEYRRRFGETPSATRQRVRARAADDALANLSCFGGSPSPSFATTREKPSLLILPLRTETLQENLEARDLTERLAATLSRTQIASIALANPSRRLSSNAPQPRNARTQYRLLGRLMHQGGRVRVIVRLVDVATDRHVWGDSFDGSVSDAFAFQDRVVDDVLCGVISRITDAEIQRAHSKDPRDVGARDLALQALPLMLQANLPSLQSAISILDRAIDMDPADATAVAFLARTYAQRANYIATNSSLATDRPAAMELSRRAGMLDSSDALVLTARGAVAMSMGRNDEAEVLAVRALSIDPTCAWAWALRGDTRRGFAGAPERAIADYQRSIRLRGPGIATSGCIYAIGAAHWNAGRFEETVRWVRRALAENPDATWMHRHLSCAAAKLGDRATVSHSVDCMRRAQPHLTVSLLVENYPFADPDWLDAISRAGLPL